MRILHNAHIYTMNGANPIAEAIAIQQGRIIDTGHDLDILNLADANTIIEDMHGCTILPGLTDSHIHLEHYAFSLQKIDCETETKTECLRRVTERAKTTPEGQWILGHGWNHNPWEEGIGTAAELDAAAPGRMVYLTSKSLHHSWCSTAALRAAGITDASPDPEDGAIGRDANGKANGILYEEAVNLIEDILPEPTIAETREALLTAQQALWQYGITGVHDFDGRRCFSALQLLDSENLLRLRVLKGIPRVNLDAAIDLGLRSGHGSPFLRTGALKLFMDGALGPQTAAMLAPYEDDPDNSGMLFMHRDEVLEYGMKAVSNGISLAVHAIGDAANREIIEAYAALRQYETDQGLVHLRHRIEHVQCLHREDEGRLSELDIIASMQPLHATSDMYTADKYWGARAAQAYIFQSLLAQNTRLIFGSDCPVESPNPFLGIHAAVTRQRPDGSPGPDGWFADQRLDFGQALEAYTKGPAYAAGLEYNAGKLAAGYFADLVVLDQHLHNLPQQYLHTVQAAATMVDGNWVFQA